MDIAQFPPESVPAASGSLFYRASQADIVHPWRKFGHSINRTSIKPAYRWIETDANL